MELSFGTSTLLVLIKFIDIYFYELRICECNIIPKCVVSKQTNKVNEITKLIFILSACLFKIHTKWTHVYSSDGPSKLPRLRIKTDALSK